MGCGAVLGLIIGLNATADVTNHWAPPGVWYEWSVAVSVTGLSMLVAEWTGEQTGSRQQGGSGNVPPSESRATRTAPA